MWRGGYLTTLGDKLNEGIKVMWTGDMVVATIDKSTLDFVNPLLKRKAYIWWNFPRFGLCTRPFAARAGLWKRA